MAAATARGFRALQERRSLALARFEAAFRKVLDARGSAADVEAESKELVASLQSVNAEIRSLEAKLRAAGAADTAALIARVQDCERDKYKAVSGELAVAFRRGAARR
jgi:Skp family chaperone for outer membrane proteins